jgi:hypothetical protein
MHQTTRFLGLDCVRLENNALSLLVTRSVGPRIIALYLPDGSNLFAEVPDRTVECPGAGEYHFYGGHRLWHAPEVLARTYLPDSSPVEIATIEDGLAATQPTEPRTGLQKTLRIRLPAEGATVIVDHVLTNRGLWPVTCAPWAITQLRPGGVAILPQGAATPEAGMLRPDRNVVLWPYTDINSPFIRWGNRFITVTAEMEATALKVGFPNPQGWLAYHWQGTLFVKKASYLPGAHYLDIGSSSQCYCDRDFLELETLGPRATIAPGESITHREVWELYYQVALIRTEDAIQGLVEELGLAAGSHSLQDDLSRD